MAIEIAGATVEQILASQKGLLAIGAGIAVGLTGLGSGLAEKDIGSAAVGAFTEKEELFGKGLIMTVIPETIVIFGFVIAIMLMIM